MDQIKKTFSSTVYHFYHSITNPKVWAAFLVLFTIMFQYFVTNSGASYGISVFCELFRMKSGSQYYIVYLSLMMIFSELPFDDPQQRMLIVRTGKRCWYISQMLYVVVECLLVMLFMTIVTFILTFGKIDFASEAEIFRWCYPMGFFVSVVYGSLVFVLNTLKRYVGTIFGAVLITLQLFQNWMIWKQLRYASMLGWRDYHVVKAMGNSGRTFVISALIFLYTAALALAFFNSRKRKDLKM